MIKKLSVTEYCNKYKISRHAVHRRIKKFEALKEKTAVNNITDVERVGAKSIVLHVNTSVRFKKKT